MKKLLKKIIILILTAEARLAMSRWQPRVIAITGSVGKTSTKDAILSVFSKISTAQGSEKSYNSEIGVPLTILGLANPWNSIGKWLIAMVSGFFTALFEKKPAEWFVLEIGADRPGDIKTITQWIRPDIAIINRIGSLPVHVEFFSSVKEVIREKAFIAAALKHNGTLIAYADDEEVEKIQRATNHRSFSFGFSEKADVAASNYQIHYGNANQPDGITFKVNFSGKSFPCLLHGALGRSHVYPALSAVASALAADFNAVSAINALRDHKTPNGRMKIIKGIKRSIIIDDSYNSSPVALKEALATLGEIKTSGRKLAVLGDMRELGSLSEKAHLEAGKEVSRVCDLLFTVGSSGRIIAVGALESGFPEEDLRQYDTSEEASREVQDLIADGDVVLVKGSQGVRMEKVTEEIMAEPEKAGELLVRQDREWKKR